MKVYQVPPLMAAIFMCLFTMGLVGIFVVLPIACIQWTWNSIVAGWSPLPDINAWQAGLLYLAGATSLYLLGFVRVDWKTRGAD